METADPPTLFLLEQYRSLRAEMLLRLGAHHRLWIWKVASLGAMASFVLADSPSGGGYILAIVPAIALAFDYLMVSNLTMISSLSRYVAESIESDSLLDGRLGWDRAIQERPTDQFGDPNSRFPLDWIMLTASTGFSAFGALVLVSIAEDATTGPIIVLALLVVPILAHAWLSWQVLVGGPSDTTTERDLDHWLRILRLK